MPFSEALDGIFHVVHRYMVKPSLTFRKNYMNKLLFSCIVGLTLTMTLAACERAKPPADATGTTATAAAVPFQKIDSVAGTGKEAVAGATAVVNYTGWLYAPGAPLQHGAQFDSSIGRAPFSFPLAADRSSRVGTMAYRA
jgi:FKBP-type peptidyl-prolyl cis-trans isomerase FkpA